MSLEDNKKIESLEKELAIVKKAFQRQEIANKLLEEKLDQALENQFSQNKQMLESYETARVRQIQLQFLDFISPQQLDNKSTNEMLLYFAENVSQLFDTADVYAFIINDNKVVSNYQLEDSDWHKKRGLKYLSASIVNLCHDSQNNWHRIEEPFNGYGELAELLKYPTCLAVSFQIAPSSHRLILLNIPHYCYSDDFKQTLELAAQQFSSNLSKRTAELEKSYNFQKLQKTISVLKSTQKKLTHNDKMVALGQLAAGVAHEINNPLSYIISNLQSLDDYQKDINEDFQKIQQGSKQQLSNATKELLEDIPDLIASCLDGLTRVGDIVKGLNTFSRQNDGDFTQLNINEVILSALKVVESRAVNKVDYQLSSNIPKIEGNFGQLQQVMVNLLINAIDSVNDVEKGNVLVNSYQQDEALIVTVVDNGEGMDNKTLKRLFDPFFTTKPTGKGTGLGLSVSYAIMMKHKAQLSVKSKLTKGTQFTLTFPIISNTSL